MLNLTFWIINNMLILYVNDVNRIFSLDGWIVNVNDNDKRAMKRVEECSIWLKNLIQWVSSIKSVDVCFLPCRFFLCVVFYWIFHTPTRYTTSLPSSSSAPPLLSLFVWKMWKIHSLLSLSFQFSFYKSLFQLSTTLFSLVLCKHFIHILTHPLMLNSALFRSYRKWNKWRFLCSQIVRWAESQTRIFETDEYDAENVRNGNIWIYEKVESTLKCIEACERNDTTIYHRVCLDLSSSSSLLLQVLEISIKCFLCRLRTWSSNFRKKCSAASCDNAEKE